MTKYPPITHTLVLDPDGDEYAAYDAARGDEDAQLWLGRLFAAKADAAQDERSHFGALALACTFSGLAAVHGKVEAVRFYRDCLSIHRQLYDYHPANAAMQDERIARLTAAVEGKADADRVEVRI